MARTLLLPVSWLAFSPFWKTQRLILYAAFWLRLHVAPLMPCGLSERVLPILKKFFGRAAEEVEALLARGGMSVSCVGVGSVASREHARARLEPWARKDLEK